MVLRCIVVPGIFNSRQGSAKAKSVPASEKVLGIRKLAGTKRPPEDLPPDDKTPPNPSKKGACKTWKRGGAAKQRILRDKVAKAEDMKLAKSIGLGLMHYRVLRA